MNYFSDINAIIPMRIKCPMEVRTPQTIKNPIAPTKDSGSVQFHERTPEPIITIK